MTPEEIGRRQKLHMDYVGPVILTASVIPGNAYIVSFKHNQTQNPNKIFTSTQQRFSKEQQYEYDGDAQKMRVWYSGPTTKVVRRTFADAGFLVTRQQETRWNICWGSPKGLDFYETLAPGQICNQIPGSNAMGRKDCLAQFMLKAAQRRPDLYNFTPKTFLIPQQLQSFVQDQVANPQQMYIYKPALGARGNGIRVLCADDQLENDKTAAVVQHYIMNPLLIQGFKFDLRIYVLVTSIEPFIFYIYEQGLGRFCTEKFVVPNRENKNHTRMHLTNFSVNCQSDAFVDGSAFQNTDAGDETVVQLGDNLPSKWKLTELLDFLDQNRQYFNNSNPECLTNKVSDEPGALKAVLLQQIEELVRRAMIAVEPRMHFYSSQAKLLHVYPRRNFGMYGFDIMIDDLGNFNLIEINSSPATGTSTHLDVDIKFELISDLLHLVGINCNLDAFDQIIYPQRCLTKDEMANQALNAEIKQFILDQDEEMFSMITSQLKNKNQQYIEVDPKQLTRFEKRAIYQLLDEQRRLGRWKRLYPLGNEEDSSVFENQRYLTELCNCFVKQNGKLEDLL